MGALEASSPLPLVINAGAPKAHHRLQSFSRAFCGSQQLQQTHTKAGPPGQSGCCPLPRTRWPAARRHRSSAPRQGRSRRCSRTRPLRCPHESSARRSPRPRVKRLETRSRSIQPPIAPASAARTRRSTGLRTARCPRARRRRAAPPCLAEGGSQCAADTSPTRGRARRKTGPRPVHMHGPHSNVSACRPYPRRTTPHSKPLRDVNTPAATRAEQRHSSFCAPRRAPARRVTVTPTALPPTPSTSVSALLPGHTARRCRATKARRRGRQEGDGKGRDEALWRGGGKGGAAAATAKAAARMA